MPTGRRRTAYRAIGGELDRIEIELLTHLGHRDLSRATRRGVAAGSGYRQCP